MVVVGQGRCSIKLEALLPMSRWRLGHRVVKEKEKRLNHLTCL